MLPSTPKNTKSASLQNVMLSQNHQNASHIGTHQNLHNIQNQQPDLRKRSTTVNDIYLTMPEQCYMPEPQDKGSHGFFSLANYMSNKLLNISNDPFSCHLFNEEKSNNLLARSSSRDKLLVKSDSSDSKNSNTKSLLTLVVIIQP